MILRLGGDILFTEQHQKAVRESEINDAAIEHDCARAGREGVFASSCSHADDLEYYYYYQTYPSSTPLGSAKAP